MSYAKKLRNTLDWFAYAEQSQRMQTTNLADRIASEIRGELARRGLQHQALALHLDITPQRLSQLLSNPGTIDLNRLERICLAIGVAPDELTRRAA